MNSIWTLFLAILLMLTAGPVRADQVVEVDVNGLACEFCAYGLESKLTELDGVLEARVSLGLKRARITFEDDATIDEASIRQAVLDAGFTPVEVRHLDTDE